MSQTVAFAPLQSRALIAVGGADWRSFLQGLITQDVETLASGEARFGALLTPQGRLLYDLFVVGRDDGAWLDVEAAHRDAILMRLTMYRLRAKVELALDPTPVSILFADDGVPARPDGAWVADPRLPQLGFRGYGAAPPPNAATVAEADREAQKLRLGVPGPADWGADKTYPIEANFDLLNGIDFKKGCFVGQETTSRMKPPGGRGPVRPRRPRHGPAAPRSRAGRRAHRRWPSGEGRGPAVDDGGGERGRLTGGNRPSHPRHLEAFGRRRTIAPCLDSRPAL